MEAEKLRTWALGAEIISALAIVVTLIFLVVETRANTAAIQDQTYQELTQQLNNYRTDVVATDYLEVRERLLTDGWEALNRVEQTKLMMLRHNLFGIYETAYFSQKRGVIGDDGWVRFESAMCNAYRSDVARGLWREQNASDMTTIEQNLTPEFARYITEACQ